MIQLNTHDYIRTLLFLNSSSQIPTVNVDLKITNVYPLKGSLQGGTKLTITGTGFGTNDSIVDIKVGDSACDVETVANTEVVCKIASAGKTHAVTNLGTDPGKVLLQINKSLFTD